MRLAALGCGAEPRWSGEARCWLVWLSGCGGGDCDFESHGLELFDEASLARGAVVVLVEVVDTEIVVDLAGGEQMPADHDDRVTNRDRGSCWSSSPADAMVLRSEVRVLRTSSSLASFDKSCA